MGGRSWETYSVAQGSGESARLLPKLDRSYSRPYSESFSPVLWFPSLPPQKPSFQMPSRSLMRAHFLTKRAPKTSSVFCLGYVSK